MKKNRLRILHIMAITIVSTMFISCAAFGESSFEKEDNDPDIKFTGNVARLDGGAIFFNIDDNESIEFSENVAGLDGGAIYVEEH